MKIEEGKFYCTRDGRKVGPMERWSAAWVTLGTRSNEICWHGDGRDWSRPADPDNDFVALWTDDPASPVRTVTRREIVPGTYGVVEVTWAGDSADKVGIIIANFHAEPRPLNASELRAAIAIFTHLADALDGEQP